MPPGALPPIAPATPAAPYHAAIVAHRGYRDETSPGNTLASFRRGIAAGATDIEFDVRRLGDGTLVVHHDPTLGMRPLSRMTRADLQQHPKGAEVPMLDDVLDLARQHPALRMTVEVKESGFEKELLSRVSRVADPSRYVVMSFDSDVVRAVKQIQPDVRAGLLMYELPIASALRKAFAPGFPVRAAQKVGADFLAVSQGMVGERLLTRAESAKMPVRVWTVDNHSQLKRFIPDRRIEAVITDLPDQAIGVRDAYDAVTMLARRIV